MDGFVSYFEQTEGGCVAANDSYHVATCISDTFEIETMQVVLDSPSKLIPNGLTPDQVISFLLS